MPTGSAAQAMSPAAAITTRDGSRTGCAPWKNTVGDVAGARDVCATVGGAGLGSPRQPVDMVMTTTDVVPTARTRRVRLRARWRACRPLVGLRRRRLHVTAASSANAPADATATRTGPTGRPAAAAPVLSLESCAASPTAPATDVSRSCRRSCTYRSPYRSLGSTWVFSLNSFQLMRPSTSGDDATAAWYS